jgi:acyl-CoA synthetase (AMP-forming)/AMP-acid ligase II/acyl carrier protein
VFQVLLTELERDGCAPPHRLRFLRSAGSAMPPQLLARLESYFRVPVLESYGMTEAYSACSNRFDGRGPTRRAGTVGPPAGAEVAILDPQGEHLHAGFPGEIVIRGASATLGYETAGPSGWIRDARGERWFASGDEGYFDPEGRLVLTGRLKEMINRGGQKVVPRRVDEALLEHPAVAEAIAFAVPHETLGQDLLAAVVLKTGVSADEQELRRHAFERLAAHEVPSRIVLVGALPYSDMGKPQRIGLAEQLGDALFSSGEPAVGEMETLIADTFAEVLEQSRPGRDANFFSLGGDSLSGQRVMVRLSAALGLELSPGLLFALPDARNLGEQLDRLLDEALAGFDETCRPELTSRIDGGR